MALLGEITHRLRGRTAAMAALLAVWLIVVAAGSGDEPEGDYWVGLPSLSWLNVVLIVLLGLGVILAAVSMVAAIRGPSRREQGKPISIRAILFIVALVWFLSGRIPPAEAPVTETAPTVAGGEQPPPTSPPADLDLVEVAVLAVILAGALGAAVVSRRRMVAAGDAGPVDGGREAALESAVDEVRETLLIGDDPRSAVIRSYQKLELALDRLGLQRHPAETPTEHLRRVLAGQTIDPVPLLRLGELYRVARFSTHPVTEADRDRAAGSLAAIGSRLAAPT